MKKFVFLSILIFSVFLTSCTIEPIEKMTDGIKFSEEYDVSKDNPFKYKTDKEILEILKSGTGIIYFGYKECPWCQGMMPQFLSALKDKKIKEVFYLNIKKIREENTKEYQEIVEILKDYLQDDESGNKRIYVPEVIIIENGKILGNNKELNKLTGDSSTYFTEEKNKEIKQSFITLIEELYKNDCNKC